MLHHVRLLLVPSEPGSPTKRGGPTPRRPRRAASRATTWAPTGPRSWSSPRSTSSRRWCAPCVGRVWQPWVRSAALDKVMDRKEVPTNSTASLLAEAAPPPSAASAAALSTAAPRRKLTMMWHPHSRALSSKLRRRPLTAWRMHGAQVAHFIILAVNGSRTLDDPTDIIDEDRLTAWGVLIFNVCQARPWSAGARRLLAASCASEPARRLAACPHAVSVMIRACIHLHARCLSACSDETCMCTWIVLLYAAPPRTAVAPHARRRGPRRSPS